MTKTATTTGSIHADAVAALVQVLPTLSPLVATPYTGSVPAAGQLGTAVSASFVGARSADLAVVVIDSKTVTAASESESSLISVEDVLRPSLEAAADVLGNGVLGAASTQDVTALFSDPDTIVYELTDDGQNAGWFLMRIRENGTVGAVDRAQSESVVGKLGRINSVEMALTVEIGRTRMSVRDVLALEPGAVIELDRSAGAPADVLLNGRLIAHGEIVVVDQDYAVRITRILDVAEGLS